MFKDWTHIRDTLTKQANFPKNNQKVLVRTIHNEIWVMIFRKGIDEASSYFAIAAYTGNIRFEPYYFNSILQWHKIPGDE
jgi:hypothetical protein